MSGRQPIPKILRSIVRTRKKLIRENVSRKNSLVCFEYIRKISNYLDAYESKWNEESWKKFVINHVSEIIYLIPENKAGLTVKTKIYESL